MCAYYYKLMSTSQPANCLMKQLLATSPPPPDERTCTLHCHTQSTATTDTWFNTALIADKRLLNKMVVSALTIILSHCLNVEKERGMNTYIHRAFII